MTVTAASNSGNFLVSPNLGVMIWTLVAFGIVNQDRNNPRDLQIGLRVTF